VSISDLNPALVFPLVYFLTPYTALIQSIPIRYAFFLAIMLAKGFVVIIGFPCTTILLTNSASSLRILGTLNGFATTFSALGRAIGPAATGAMFSWGVRNGYAIAPWWMLGFIAMLGAVVPWFIVEGAGPTSSLGEVEEQEGDAEEEDEEDAERGGLLRGRCTGENSDVEGDDDVAILEAVEDGEESGSELDERGQGKKSVSGYGTMNGGSR